MLNPDMADNIDLHQAKWRLRYVQGLLRHHRTKRRPQNFSWRVEQAELLDRISHAHVHLEEELRKESPGAKKGGCTLPFPAF
ncbi:hypothetical protein [Roseimicrobium sp. ORNL1]|uniref:hypothetical protein n=1 Tax=Roseimicrobium sp. ORNL1 TaxID=2711231 RepID=UPI0013E1923A|nr:hypothetical protein [Roseimicrobium sp. ORNL1]QIF03271.1 hypothetical protein G5S37_17655 [Roseimicrobium sp. ORNL1]